MKCTTGAALTMICVALAGLVGMNAVKADELVYGDRSYATQMYGGYTGTPRDAAAFDFNHNGTKDLLLATPEIAWQQIGQTVEKVPRFMNVTDDVFAEIQLPTNPEGFLIADYNNDSWIDLYVPSLSSAGHKLLRNDAGEFADVTSTAGSAFTSAANRRTMGGAWGDYDADGDVDLLLLIGIAANGRYDFGSNTQVLLKNNTAGGSTTFEADWSTGFAPRPRIRQAFWVDFNKDHDLDLVLMQGCDDITYCSGDYSTYYVNVVNNGQREFVDNLTGFPGKPYLKGFCSLGTVTDVNNDGQLDLLYLADDVVGYLVKEDWDDGIPNWNDGEVKLKSGWERAPWTPIGTQPLDIASFDFNLDGRCDLLGVNGWIPVLYPNYDAGSQDYAYPQPTDAIHAFGAAGSAEANRGTVSADFVNDGLTELYFARPSTFTGVHGFFYKAIDQTPSTAPKWIGVQLQATAGSNNYCGIGATVTVTAGSHVQAQVVDGGSGRGFQNDLNLVFGLGDYAGSTVDIEVYWPAGQTNLFPGLQVGQYHVLGDVPNVIESTVSGGLIYHVGSEVTDWEFKWETGPNADQDLDRVILNTVKLSQYCMPAYSVLSTSVPNVTVVIEPTDVGTFLHTLTWSNVECRAPCDFPYTVQSAVGTYVSTSSVDHLFVPACIAGDN